MRKLSRILILLAAVVTVAWLGVCAWLSAVHPRVAFRDSDLRAPAAPLPKGFLWGTSTSAHQIEGGNRNDWTRFEAKAGPIERGDTSAIAADGWRRMFDDIALMKRIHANAYRFSIEWSRVEPNDGAWDEEAWSRYTKYVKALRAHGITPMVTLLHFTLPLWMADRGGVAAPDFPARFARFAAEAGRRLGSDVDLWITLNEPNVQLYIGYLAGQWPPLLKSPPDAVKAYRGLLRAHAAAATVLRAADPGCRIGLANNLMLVEPRSRLMLGDWVAAYLVDRFWNWSFPEAVRNGRARLRLPGASLNEAMPELRGSTDFFGLNYYFRYFVRPAPSRPEMVVMEPGPGLLSELGGNDPIGDSPPEALLVLMRDAWRRYGQPIYVTEGGIADERGTLRGTLIRGQRLAIDRALAEGIAVEGYLHWSLLDNFEWDKGYRPRFGLFRVDRATLERTPAGGTDVFAGLAPLPVSGGAPAEAQTPPRSER
jgi:beta-glucosidase